MLDSQEEVQAAYQFGSDTSLRSKVIFSPAELRAFRTLGVNPGEPALFLLLDCNLTA